LYENASRSEIVNSLSAACGEPTFNLTAYFIDRISHRIK